MRPCALRIASAEKPGDVMRVGPLHGRRSPPFYVGGSDQSVAGYMEGVVQPAP